MLLQSSDLNKELSRSSIFVDTNVLVVCSRSTELRNFVSSLRNESNCSFESIPSVLFEFVRGSNSLQAYNENTDFYNEIVSRTHPTKIFENTPDFSVVMAKVNSQNKSYTDFLLAAALYHYKNSGDVYLLTTDTRAFPSFFEMPHLITVCEDKSGEIRNFGFIKFNETSYAKAAKSIIKEAS